MRPRFSPRIAKTGPIRNRRVRRLLFDSLEDRRLLAGLTIFVYDDADQSGTWEKASEPVLKEHVVFIDQDGNGRLGSEELSAITDNDGRAIFDNLSTGQALVRLFGSGAPGLSININDVADTLTANLGGAARPDNQAPILESIPTQSVDEDGELDLPSSLLAELASDADNDALAYFISGTPSKGSLSWSVEDGGKYKPESNYFGSDSIFVRAFDGSAWSEPVKLDITINSVDDAPLAIRFNGSSIPENEAGYVVGDFSLDDIDGGEYSIELSPESLFEIKDGKLKLADGQSIDFEQTPSIELTINVSAGATSLSGTYSLPVTNRNDAPTSLSFSGETRIEEFVDDGFQFGTVSVNDQDVGEVYDFAVSDNRFEVIDSVLSLKTGASLVFADAPSVAVTVTATSQTSGEQVQGSIDIEVVRAAPPWQNKNWALDVNNDGELGPVDVLIVINALNRMGLARLDRLPPPGSTSLIDVNGDRQLTPLDALILINALNQQRAQGSGSGDPSGNGGNSGGNSNGSNGTGESEGEGGDSMQPSPSQRFAGPPIASSANEISHSSGCMDVNSVLDNGNTSVDDASIRNGIRRGSRRIR